jgi:hypothetical protein
MNNEQQELLDKAYNVYGDSHWIPPSNPKGKLLGDQLFSVIPMEHSKESFVNECKTNKKFSEKWGLNIEERELSLDEKEWQLEKTNCINDIENDRIIYGHEWEKYIQDQYEGIQSNQGISIPTKAITITYNDKTIESYE